MNSLIAGVVLFGIGYWIGRGSPRVTIGAVYDPESERYTHYTEDDPRPFKMVENPYGAPRTRGCRQSVKLRRGCKLQRTIKCKRRAL